MEEVNELNEANKVNGVNESSLNAGFETDKIISEINKNKFKLVGLQFPEGLRRQAVKVAEEIERKTSARAVIFFDPIYGACDTKKKDAEILNLDLIVHFGHEEL